jgi:AbrB family looped-hinge helix DNA binding protein
MNIVVSVLLMPIKFEISVVEVGRSLKVTIPVEITKYLNIKKGDTVLMSIDDSHIIIEKKKESSP